jgi:hypothetical protein
MSVMKFLAGLTAIAVGAAVVTALAGVEPEDKAPAAKADRPDAPASIPACAPEPWPYGCQWRAPTNRRVSRTTRSF